MNLSADSIRTLKLTFEKRERCVVEGRCLRCRRSDHFARNCIDFTRSSLRASEAALDSDSSAYVSVSSSPSPIPVLSAAPIEQLKE
jgi:hypothetical protein